MLDVLCPLITESDNVPSQLLDIILINIAEPQKSSKKNTYHLAKELIIKTDGSMEQYIQQVKLKKYFDQIDAIYKSHNAIFIHHS